MAEVPHPFDYQAPTAEHVAHISAVREACKLLYNVLLAEVPACAERTIAFRHLEEVSMFANKAIVFDGVRYLG